MKSIYTSLVILILAFLVSCNSEEKNTSKTSTEPITVQVEKVSASNNNTLQTSGKIKAVNQAQISTRIMGYIESVPVKVGQEVQKGDVLVQLNSQDLIAKKAQAQAQIAKAKSHLLNLEKNYNRFKNLLDKQSISQKEFDDIKMAYQMAKESYNAAQQMQAEVNAQLSYSIIKAPFNGTITNTFAEVGNLAKPGEYLVEIENNQIFEVSTSLAESQINRINIKTPVEVNVQSIDAKLSGQITELASSANTAGQYAVSIQLNSSPETLKSGMYATVEFHVNKSTTPQLYIKSDAIVKQGELRGVYTISSQNTAVLNWLKLGSNKGGLTEVISGLSANETYITTAEAKLYNGAPIELK
ncbi:efflux RND transporter periplasmic adaptor subunit [Psychroflexus sp. ALD_RP9]|uniref:efflux RND transporter periplasmic adaptor subunit n=1 Tax=Psychroflexus sp. ALD_RP9 TaxID=2777186 RepID=UPI001A8C3A46|nr:efflux RND transporter periplasmic adaptor subunit [Psychroflexus sp. ALD_RP9]QSS97874.1 efflux RND transporter periplasmic adaptor subunit [Psychroflexus sp. ALD_RP9]